MKNPPEGLGTFKVRLADGAECSTIEGMTGFPVVFNDNVPAIMADRTVNSQKAFEHVMEWLFG